MDLPADQTSEAPTQGPTRTIKVIDPMVDDLSELFLFAKAAVAEINTLRNDINELQNRPIAAAIDASAGYPTSDGLYWYRVTGGVGAWEMVSDTYEDGDILTCDGTRTFLEKI